jgi:hypothetical protein
LPIGFIADWQSAWGPEPLAWRRIAGDVLASEPPSIVRLLLSVPVGPNWSGTETAFVTGMVRVCAGFVTGFVTVKSLMGNIVTDVTGKMGVRLKAEG